MLSVGAQLTDHLRHHSSWTGGISGQGGRAVGRVRIPTGRRAAPLPTPVLAGNGSASPSPSLAARPVLIADEPTTALDVTCRRVLHCADLATRWGWRAADHHDLGVMSAVADRVAVMHTARCGER